MDILVYRNRKIDDIYYDVSTPEKRKTSFLKLFRLLDDEWEVYEDLKDLEMPGVCEPCTKGLHRCCERECICDKTEECKKKATRCKSSYARKFRQRDMYEKARAGDAKMAERLLMDRKDYEYEHVELRSVKS